MTSSPQEEDKNISRIKIDMLPIVGIGASAGGLKALCEFFRLVPEDSGVAYVIVLHLSPEHKSLLAELLQPHLKMPVTQVNQTMQLERNHVYVIPPNANLNSIDTHLRLSELEQKRSERAPIDHFFYTLAKTHDGSAIGVVLTGTGSDGTLGMKEIKARGGLTIVQNPDEAEYDGMPQSAITTGIIDLVLPLAEIPKYIIKYVNTTHDLVQMEQENAAANLEQARLLIAEDDDFCRIMLSELLKMWGIQHDKAVNGREAVQLAGKNHYDMVLIDVHMPVMDGFEATRMLRKMENYKIKPIFAITADGSNLVNDGVSNNLFTGKILKPFEPEELLKTIKKVLAEGIKGQE
jgi:chemotaxis response regulator CheB